MGREDWDLDNIFLDTDPEDILDLDYYEGAVECSIRKHCTCKICGREGLHWEKRGAKWWLCDRRGRHVCSKKCAPASLDELDLTI